MSVHRFISLWGVWYLQRKSTPKKEVLWLKTLDFWRLFEDFESEEIGVTLKTSIFMRGIWSMETFVFIVSFSLSWVIGNTILLKGVEVILRKQISKWCSSQNPTPTQSFEWSHWKSHISSVNFFIDRDEDLLVSGEFVPTEELGIHQCGLPTQWGTW